MFSSSQLRSDSKGQILVGADSREHEGRMQRKLQTGGGVGVTCSMS